MPAVCSVALVVAPVVEIPVYRQEDLKASAGLDLTANVLAGKKVVWIEAGMSD